MWRFLKRKRVIKECDSSAGDADNSDEVRVEESQVSDKFHYSIAAADKSKAVLQLKLLLNGIYMDW
jgi:hypothetical protein